MPGWKSRCVCALMFAASPLSSLRNGHPLGDSACWPMCGQREATSHSGPALSPRPAQVPGGHAEAPEDLPDGACWQPGCVGPGRLPVPAIHLGQFTADRYWGSPSTPCASPSCPDRQGWLGPQALEWLLLGAACCQPSPMKQPGQGRGAGPGVVEAAAALEVTGSGSFCVVHFAVGHSVPAPGSRHRVACGKRGAL